MKKQVAGSNLLDAGINFYSPQTFGDTKAHLVFSQPKVKVGEEVTLIFNWQHKSDNRLITDLPLYLV